MKRKIAKFETSTDDYVQSKLFPKYRVNFEKGTVINSKDRLLGSPSNRGYLTIGLYPKGTTTSVHRFIYQEAHPDEEIKPGEDIDHINNIRSDNRLCNLQKITHRENVQKAAKTRDYSFAKNNHSKEHRKYILETCLETEKKKLYGALYQVTKKRGFNPGSVKMICEGICKKIKSKTNNKTYIYRYISKEKFEKLKTKYKCYERKKMTEDELKEKYIIYRETFRNKMTPEQLQEKYRIYRETFRKKHEKD